MKCPECGHQLAESEFQDEPPVGTWVRVKNLRYGARVKASFYRQKGGWSGGPGFYPGGRWDAMLERWGPMEVCGPYGVDERRSTTPGAADPGRPVDTTVRDILDPCRRAL